MPNAAYPLHVPTVDHYRLLGISRHASIGIIRRAYVAKMKRHHPDRVGDGAPQTAFASALGEAYACLANARTRASYDLTLTHDDAGQARTRQAWRVRHGARRPHDRWNKLVRPPTFGRRGFAAVAMVALVAIGIAVFNLPERRKPRLQTAATLPAATLRPREPRRSVMEEAILARNAVLSIEQARKILSPDACNAIDPVPGNRTCIPPTALAPPSMSPSQPARPGITVQAAPPAASRTPVQAKQRKWRRIANKGRRMPKHWRTRRSR